MSVERTDNRLDNKGLETLWGRIVSLLETAVGTISSIINTKADDSSVVHKTGDETITGVKTFPWKIQQKAGKTGATYAMESGALRIESKNSEGKGAAILMDEQSVQDGDVYQIGFYKVNGTESSLITSIVSSQVHSKDSISNAGSYAPLVSGKAVKEYIDSLNIVNQQDISGKVDKSGDTMSGALHLVSNYYLTNNKYGLNMHNSDIINANSIYTADVANNTSEGLRFYRDGTKWDTLLVKNGVIWFRQNGTLEGESLNDVDIHKVSTKKRWSIFSGSSGTGGKYITLGSYTHTPSQYHEWEITLRIIGHHSSLHSDTTIRIAATDSNSTEIQQSPTIRVISGSADAGVHLRLYKDSATKTTIRLYKGNDWSSAECELLEVSGTNFTAINNQASVTTSAAYAKDWIGYLQCNYDGDGNKIQDTYVKKLGDTMIGGLGFPMVQKSFVRGSYVLLDSPENLNGKIFFLTTSTTSADETKAMMVCIPYTNVPVGTWFIVINGMGNYSNTSTWWGINTFESDTEANGTMHGTIKAGYARLFIRKPILSLSSRQSNNSYYACYDLINLNKL